MVLPSQDIVMGNAQQSSPPSTLVNPTTQPRKPINTATTGPGNRGKKRGRSPAEAGPSKTQQRPAERDRITIDRSRQSGPANQPGQNKQAKRPKPPPKPLRPKDMHVRKVDLPEDTRATKACFELHIRILWKLSNQLDIPAVVSDDTKSTFRGRFSTEADIQTTVYKDLDDHADTISEARDQMHKFLDDLPEPGPNIIANNIRQLGEEHILLMYQTVAALGLSDWAPDVHGGDPRSVYNLLHEHVAVRTFELVCAAHGYFFMGINMTQVTNQALLHKLYRSFVFSHMRKKVLTEEKSPGKLKERQARSTASKRRVDKSKSRTQVVQDRGFQNNVRMLVNEYDAHSDDEHATIYGEMEEEEAVFFSMHKEGRSEKAMKFSHLLDIQARQSELNKRGANRIKKPAFRRMIPPIPYIIKFSTTPLPKRVPIDWFTPDYWNYVLTTREKAEYLAFHDGEPKVGLPPAEFCEDFKQCEVWKNLEYDDFMHQYGNDVLEEYIIPTQAELDRVNEWELTDDEVAIADEVAEETEVASALV